MEKSRTPVRALDFGMERVHSDVVAGEGFEPSQTESESVVLPLHNPAMSNSLIHYICKSSVCQVFSPYLYLRLHQYFLPAIVHPSF